MESRRRHISEDDLTIPRRNTRSNTSLSERENSLPFPIDLIIEIFSRLPAKSIARCRCVSKLWASILRLPDFTELFFTKALARPQLLFACDSTKGFVFFSSNQPQNLDEISCAVTANHLAHIPSFCEIFGTSNGFFCLRSAGVLKEKKNPVPVSVSVSVSVICNPSTGQSLPLPYMKEGVGFGLRTYFGYDPIEKQFKVLSMYISYSGISKEHQLLTLGTGKLSWRMIECCIPHYPNYKGICINGVLYYIASFKSVPSMIVCFDFMSEKFIILEVMETFNRSLPYSATLINYNGKLGLLMMEGVDFVSGRSKSLELWVLEDAGKHEWSKQVYVLPPFWENVVGKGDLYFVGMIGTYEIVLSTMYQYVPSYVFYYNLKKSTITRVEIQGMEAFEGNRFYTFINHVENMKLIQAFQNFIT